MLDESGLADVYTSLCSYLDQLLLEFPGEARRDLVDYFRIRGQEIRSIKQDLLPLLAVDSLVGQLPQTALPLAATWALHLAAAHAFDEAQDSAAISQINVGILALGAATLAALDLEIEPDARDDISEALARMIILGANAQQMEASSPRGWSRKEYFSCIAGKAAAIITTGVWIGGRLIASDGEVLKQLKSFGLALGMSIQLADDLGDLDEDLANNLWTLAVLEGLENTGHPDYPELRALLSRTAYSGEDIARIRQLLDSMAAHVPVRQLIMSYKAQAKSFFTAIPGLETHFAEYVAQ